MGIVASPLTNKDGDIIATIEVVRDLTEQKGSEKEKAAKE